jgi:hypothetical protein
MALWRFKEAAEKGEIEVALAGLEKAAATLGQAMLRP